MTLATLTTLAKAKTKKQNYKDAFVNCVMAETNNNYTLALTLTTKYKMAFNKQGADAREVIDARVSKELRYVRHKVNTELFGGNWRRKGLFLKTYSLRERAENKPHYHLLIEVNSKNPLDIKRIGRIFIKYWQKTDIGGKHNKIEIAHDRLGWLNYCVKTLSKNDANVIDVMNCVTREEHI